MDRSEAEVEVLEFLANSGDGALAIEDAADWELEPSALASLLASGLVEELVPGVATLAPAWFASEAPNAHWFVEARCVLSMEAALAAAVEGERIGFWAPEAWTSETPGEGEVYWVWRVEGGRRVPTFDRQ